MKRSLILAGFSLSWLFAWSTAVAEAPKAEAVSFVSYNLKNYLLMERSVDGETDYEAPKPEEEIEVLISHLAEIKPDILGVCEIGDEGQLADLQKRLKEAGVDLPEASLCLSTDGVRNLALLSRFPVTAENHQRGLDYQLGSEVIPFRRGILDVTVSITPEYEVRFIGLHFKSKRPVPGADQALMRRNEAHLTRLHIQSVLKEEPETNLVAYGDLNDTRNEAPVRALSGVRGESDSLQAIRLEDADGATWTYFWSYADVYSRFDFVFASKGLLPEVDQESSYLFKADDWFTASDHRPLVLMITPEDE